MDRELSISTPAPAVELFQAHFSYWENGADILVYFLDFLLFFFGMDSTRYKNTSARYLMDVQEIFSILIFHVCKVIISSFFHFKSCKKIENGNEHDPK